MKMLTEARISIKCPYYSGEVGANVIDAPLYDVIVGNIPKVRAAGGSDLDWNSET